MFTRRVRSAIAGVSATTAAGDAATASGTCTGRPSAASAIPAPSAPAAVISQAAWKSAAVLVAVPSTATSTATPSAEPIWRPIVSTAAPVAKRSGGSEEAPAPVKVGITKPTPAPPITIPGRNSAT